MTIRHEYMYATRKSALALAQSQAFISELKSHHMGVRFKEIQVVTTGDQIQDRPLSQVGGKGLFVKEIEEALLHLNADMAVHSIKDVPTILPPGLQLSCIPERESALDVFLSVKYEDLMALPPKAKVGTSSLRREVTLLRMRPDLKVIPLRGNVDTRIRKLIEGEVDAIILAHAGIRRLKKEKEGGVVLRILPSDLFLPAVGQGALGIETRQDDEDVMTLLSPIHDFNSACCVAAERGVLKTLEGDCRTPLAAYAEKLSACTMHDKTGTVKLDALEGEHERGERLRLRAWVSEPDGSRYREQSLIAAWPKLESEAFAIGHELGKALKG